MQTLTIVGVGLIGGSIGLAAKRRGLAARVRGVGRQQGSLDRALAVGAIDEGHLDLGAAVRDADVVVVCSPVHLIAGQVLAAARSCNRPALLTDAGSAKGVIVGAVEDGLPPGALFVGSHPLAGSDKSGPEYAEADLFQDRLTVVTPTARTPADALERALAFWRALGSRTHVMAPHEHDHALALTSHLPHLLASVLAGILPESLYNLTATGFRDTTRVAAGDPAVWTGIFAQNRAAVLEALGRFGDHLARFREALAAGDWTTVDALLAQGKKVRDALGSSPADP